MHVRLAVVIVLLWPWLVAPATARAQARPASPEVRAINPRIKVGAATIAWGRPPATRADFDRVSPTQRVFQDWRAWLADGLLDMAVPMNYASEHDERVRRWFNGWIARARSGVDRNQAHGAIPAHTTRAGRCQRVVRRCAAEAGNLSRPARRPGRPAAARTDDHRHGRCSDARGPGRRTPDLTASAKATAVRRSGARRRKVRGGTYTT